MGLFGKTSESDPKKRVTEWERNIRKEGYRLDRQIRGILREEEKVKRTLREAAKKGDKDTCKILAKEVIRARKAITKIHTTKAHLNSVQLQLKNQLAMLKVSGSLSSSTEVMQAMQSLVKYADISETMTHMSQEMMKAGIIEEMIEETLDAVEDSEEIEDEADQEIDKVLWEITEGKIGEAPVPPKGATAQLPDKKEQDGAHVEEEADSSTDEEDLVEMRNRLAELRS